MSTSDSPVIATVPLGPYQTNCFVVAVAGSDDQAFLVDCGDTPEPLFESLDRSGRRLAGILLTHAHHDHIAGIDLALKRYGSLPIHAPRLEAAWNMEPMLNLSAFLGRPARVTPPTDLFEEGDACPLGPGWRILHLPGHSPGSSAFLHEEAGILLAGDTLFAGSIGRVDFPTSDPASMKSSLDRILELDDRTRVLPGHGPETSIGRERATNPFLGPDGMAF